MSLLKAPISNSTTNAGKGIRAVILAPTRELAHQIYNECLKLAQGRKWRIILFSKATAATLADKSVQDKVGMSRSSCFDGICADVTRLDVVISTPLRLVASLRSGHLSFHKYVHLPSNLPVILTLLFRPPGQSSSPHLRRSRQNARSGVPHSSAGDFGSVYS